VYNYGNGADMDRISIAVGLYEHLRRKLDDGDPALENGVDWATFEIAGSLSGISGDQFPHLYSILSEFSGNKQWTQK
jgi:hypothetical protein